MNFRDFQQKYKEYPFIKSTYFVLEEDPPYVRRLVSEWKKKEWLLELRRGMYLINQDHILSETERFNIANAMYEPSYVSLEAALAFYGMIPEWVPQITSVSTRKTARFSNALGKFSYSQIRKDLFWGYKKQSVGKRYALIATPEKALLDLIYLRKGEFKNALEIIDSLRLDNLTQLSSRSLMAAADRFKNSRILQLGTELSRSLRGNTL